MSAIITKIQLDFFFIINYWNYQFWYGVFSRDSGLIAQYKVPLHYSISCVCIYQAMKKKGMSQTPARIAMCAPISAQGYALAFFPLFFLSHPSKLGLEQMRGKLDFEEFGVQIIQMELLKSWIKRQNKTRLFIVYVYFILLFCF